MPYPESWTCPSCGATVFNSVKCNICGYQPPSESGELHVQTINDNLLKERVIAFIIDVVFIILIASMLSIAVAMSLYQVINKSLNTTIELFIIPINMLFLVFHPVYFMILEGMYSTTYGKKIMHVELRTGNNSKIGFKKSLVRNVMRFIEAIPLYIPSIMAIKNDGLRWGDKLAGTRVVREQA